MEPLLPELPFLANLKREFRLLRDAPPGRRFTRRHKRMLARKPPTWKRVARILGSGLVAVAGVAALPLPGPGSLLIVLGVAMLAGEFAFVATFLDHVELRLRRLLGAGRRWWRRAGWVTRAAVILAAVAISTGAAWVVWQVFFAA